MTAVKKVSGCRREDGWTATYCEEGGCLAGDPVPAGGEDADGEGSESNEGGIPEVEAVLRAGSTLVDDLDLDSLAAVVHVLSRESASCLRHQRDISTYNALAACLLVAVVFEAHGGAVGSLHGADGDLACAEVDVAGVLVVVVSDTGVVGAEGSGGERHGSGGERLDGDHDGCCGG